LYTGWLTEKWCLVYWEDEESVTVVPEKDVNGSTVTNVKDELTGLIAAMGKLQCEK